MSNLGSSTNPPSRLFIGDGGASAPSITFGNDTDLGLYRSGTDTMRFVSNGAEISVIETTGLRMINGMQFSAGTGNASVPSITFIGDTDTGFYKATANSLSITCGTNERVRFEAQGNGVNFVAATDGDSSENISITNSGTGYAGFRANNTGSGASITISATGTGATGNNFPGYPGADTTIVQSSGAATFVIQTTGAAPIGIGTNSTIALEISTSQRLLAPNGSSGAPTWSFLSEPTMGMWRGGTADLTVQTDTNNYIRLRNGAIGIYVSGTEIADFEAANGFYPVPDNTRTLGRSGFRWTAVWAANGTIQTSHSSTKQNIIEVDPTQLEIPLAVEYDRDGRRWLGYLNDSLPATGRPDTDPTANYEQAVIGVLCAKLKQAFEEIDKLKAKIGE